MKELVNYYLAQLIPGFLYVYYYLGYNGNITIFSLQVIFYSIMFSVVARTLFKTFEFGTVGLAIFVMKLTRITTVRLSQPLIHIPETKKSVENLSATVDKKLKEAHNILQNLFQEFKDPAKLFKQSEDNFLLIILFSFAVVVDKLLLHSTRNKTFLLVFVILLSAIWLMVTDETIRSVRKVVSSLPAMRKARNLALKEMPGND